MSIVGSQLCPTAPEPGGGNADQDRRPAVECRGDRVRSRGQAFLAHQSDDNLCLYWGTPSKNEGGAWCERLAACTLARGLALGLDVDGRLVGHCGSKRVWPPDLSKDFQPADYWFEGVARKAVNGNIISTERKLNNFGLTEYRVVEFSWHMLYDGLLPGEAVESDVCLTIFDANKLTSLETGEELLCTHEHVHRPKRVDDETISGRLQLLPCCPAGADAAATGGQPPDARVPFPCLAAPRRSRHGAADDIYTITTARSQHRPLIC